MGGMGRGVGNAGGSGLGASEELRVILSCGGTLAGSRNKSFLESTASDSKKMEAWG